METETSVEDATVNLDTDVRLGTLAVSLSRQMIDDDVINFVKILDQKMANWDFTQAMASYFAGQMRELHKDTSSGGDSAAGCLSEVSEFIRQITINPSVKFDPNFYTVWTDPQAQPAALNIHTLEVIRDLATLSLSRLDS